MEIGRAHLIEPEGKLDSIKFGIMGPIYNEPSAIELRLFEGTTTDILYGWGLAKNRAKVLCIG